MIRKIHTYINITKQVPWGNALIVVGEFAPQNKIFVFFACLNIKNKHNNFKILIVECIYIYPELLL